MLAPLLSWNLTPAAVSTLPNPPGRVYKSQYPYWKPRKKPYWEQDEDERTEEAEMLAAMGIDL